MIESILVCNAGSSSLKVYCSHPAADKSAAHEFAGQQSGLLTAFEDWLSSREEAGIVLHRIVHAGAVTEMPRKLDAALRAQILHWQSLAPLHNPLALELIAAVENAWPTCSQYAIFDAGLFSNLPALSKTYPLPAELSSRWPVQRYGFHGLAHRSQMRTLQAQGQFERVITLQLGGGTSVAAWYQQKVIDTTMGFTPLEGLPMGSRSGSIDPGILLHLIENEGFSAESLHRLLNEQSGLKALSGGLVDMRELLASDTDAARFAVAYYCYELRKAIGAYVAILGGIDAVTIGGGIGEHQPLIRSQVFAGLSHLSLSLSAVANASAEGLTALHDKNSAAAIWLTPIDEADEMLRQYAHFRRLHRL